MDNPPRDATSSTPTISSDSDGCPQPPSRRQKSTEKAEHRKEQNRMAAARHRQREQDRLSVLTTREAMLKQRVSELELEIDILRKHREGLPAPERDPLTSAIIKMTKDVSDLHSNLARCLSETQTLVEEASIYHNQQPTIYICLCFIYWHANTCSFQGNTNAHHCS